jgi:hypothetical protein
MARDDVSRYGGRMVADTWQYSTVTGGRHVGHPVIDTWHVLVGCWCATWPSHGLPRGTLWLVDGFVKIYVGSPGSNPRPSSGQRTGRTGLTARPMGSTY